MTKYFFILLACIMAFLVISFVSLKYTSGDFDVYYSTGQNFLNKAPVYIAHDGIDEFKYAPLFALLFSPLTFLDKISALYLWTVLNIVFFYAIFFLLYKLKQISFNQPKDLMIAICLLALTGRFIFNNFRLGQVNMFLCFLMVLMIYLEINKKYFWTAVVLSFSLTIKFFPLLFVLYFLLRKRFKILVYCLPVLVLFLLLPSLYTGWGLNLKYLHDWQVLLGSTPATLMYSVKNNSFLSYYSWLFIARHEPYHMFGYDLIKKGLTWSVYFAWMISCIVFFILFYYDTFLKRDKDLNVTYLDYASLFVCGLLFNPLAYLNALTFMIIPYFFILRYLFYSQVSRKYVYLTVGLICLSFILNMLDNKVFFRNPYFYFDILELKPLMWSIILVYLSLWVAKFSLKLK